MADHTLTETSDIDIDESVAGQVLLTLKPRAFVALTDGATITWATGGVDRAKAAVTLGGNRTLDVTGEVDGQEGTLVVTQDGTGGRTLSVPGVVLNGPLALADGAGEVTVLAFVCHGSTLYWAFGASA